MALNARYLDDLPCRTYVLLGDSEMTEGSQWEAIQVAAHYELDNLTGIIDVNRLGQRGETLYGHDIRAYEDRVGAFGWKTITIDGHSMRDIQSALSAAARGSGQPTMIIAKTIKGKGVSFVENENGRHGKALDSDELERALEELGEVDRSMRGEILRPEELSPLSRSAAPAGPIDYASEDEVATRDAFGNALNRIYPQTPGIVSLDGEVSNSTRAEHFGQQHPDRFFEMYVAEQNMVGVALGLSCRGKIPFVSTFAAFMTRAYDQIRMSQYSDPNIKFVGSHAGVSIGQDGPSQMGLEDLAFFRTIQDATVLYPCDAVSTEKLVEASARHDGIVYLRTTRMATPLVYEPEEEFPIGGSKVLRSGPHDAATLVAAGVTLHEALAASDDLAEESIPVRVIDLYSVEPLDAETLRRAVSETGHLIVVEDHYPQGGLADAVRRALTLDGARVHSLAVSRRPKSGKPRELLDYEGISRGAIVDKVRTLVRAG